MSYPNQKKIEITKEPCNKENKYTVVNLEAQAEAMKNLKNDSYKLWSYLGENRQGYTLELSQKALESRGIKKDSYYKAVKDLIEKGYLVQKREDSNIYIFKEKPAAKAASSPEAKVWDDSEKQNDSEIQKDFVCPSMEIQKTFSENQKSSMEIQKTSMENQQRNITNTTSITSITADCSETFSERMFPRQSPTAPTSSREDEYDTITKSFLSEAPIGVTITWIDKDLVRIVGEQQNKVFRVI